jgi:hypothetical protein
MVTPDTAFGSNGAAACAAGSWGGPGWTSISNPAFGPGVWVVNGFRVGALPVPAGPLTGYTDSIVALSWEMTGAGATAITSTLNEWADSTAVTFPLPFALPYQFPGGAAGFQIP